MYVAWMGHTESYGGKKLLCLFYNNILVGKLLLIKIIPNLDVFQLLLLGHSQLS